MCKVAQGPPTSWPAGDQDRGAVWPCGRGQRVTRTQTRIGFFGHDSVLGHFRVIKKLYIFLYFLYKVILKQTFFKKEC